MGLGRSYGDAFINSKGYVLALQKLNRFVSFNPASGLLRCESGTSLDDIINIFTSRGWFIPVTPGTKFVTVGGMIASDVHGKNHHRMSSFSRHVMALRVLLASGEVVECSRLENQDLFWGTLGGMGLTGVILEAEFCLRKLTSRYVRGISVRTRNLDQCVATFEALDPKFEYTVAWLDCHSRGGNFGRGVFMAGSHLSAEDSAFTTDRSIGKGRHLTAPSRVSFPVITDYSMSLFNTIYYYLADEHERLSRVDAYFYPLDAVRNWNRLYGNGGFLQYQFVVPSRNGVEGIAEVLAALRDGGYRPYLSILKKFGEQEGLLSFPMPGYTLALDFPITNGIFRFLDSLDKIVIDYGGRVYLAKDCRLGRGAFVAMYPQFQKWLGIKDRYDPGHVFRSSLSRRLGITHS